jgi:Right handed beta helix region
MRVLSLGLIAAALTAAPPPAILFIDVESGPVTGGPSNLGVPISIFGSGFGAMRGTSTVTIGGVEAAAYPVWGSHNPFNKTLDMIVVQPGPKSKGGAIVVTVDGKASNSNHTFIVNKGKVIILKPGDDVLSAIKKAAAGDTILLRGGTYRDGELWVRRVEGDSGKPGDNKTLKSYPGEEVIFNNRARPFILSADYITVSGLKFLNGKSLGITEEGDKGRLRGNKLVNNYGAGDMDYAFMDSHGDSHTLAGNVCEAASSSQGTQGHCFYISYGDGVKLLWNVAGGAPGYGIHVFDQRRAAGDFRRVISNLLIEGNILKGSTERSGLILTMGDEDKLGNAIDGVIIRNNLFTANNHAGLVLGDFVRNVKVYNNTFYQNGRVELYAEDKQPRIGYEVRNNLFYHSKNQWCKSNCAWYPDGHIQFTSGAGKSVTLSNNGYFPNAPAVFNGSNDGASSISVANAITGPLQFINPIEFDFRLKPGAAAINRGAALPVPTDYLGVTRPQEANLDLGAFEFSPD